MIRRENHSNCRLSWRDRVRALESLWRAENLVAFAQFNTIYQINIGENWESWEKYQNKNIFSLSFLLSLSSLMSLTCCNIQKFNDRWPCENYRIFSTCLPMKTSSDTVKRKSQNISVWKNFKCVDMPMIFLSTTFSNIIASESDFYWIILGEYRWERIMKQLEFSSYRCNWSATCMATVKKSNLFRATSKMVFIQRPS